MSSSSSPLTHLEETIYNNIAQNVFECRCSLPELPSDIRFEDVKEGFDNYITEEDVRSEQKMMFVEMARNMLCKLYPSGAHVDRLVEALGRGTTVAQIHGIMWDAPRPLQVLIASRFATAFNKAFVRAWKLNRVHARRKNIDNV